MKRNQGSSGVTDAVVGYASDDRGRGVAYARVGDGSAKRFLRVPFRSTVPPAAEDRRRDGAYAAATAVVQALRARGVRSVRLGLPDADVVEELTAHRELPDGMVLPYVRLRCALNGLDAFELRLCADSDLIQRARAEVALHIAA